jgi:hypothetical protein
MELWESEKKWQVKVEKIRRKLEERVIKGNTPVPFGVVHIL